MNQADNIWQFPLVESCFPLMTDSPSPTASAEPVHAATERQRLQPDHRREQIMDAAVACYLAKGGVEATMTEIAASIGVTRNLIYHYFKNQDALLNAIFEREAAALNDKIAAIPDGPAEEVMTEVVRTYLHYLAERTEALSIMLANPAARSKLKGHVHENLSLILERFSDSLHLELTGGVRSAMKAAADFLMTFAAAEHESLALAEDEAVALCVAVFRTAADGGSRYVAALKARDDAPARDEAPEK